MLKRDENSQLAPMEWTGRGIRLRARCYALQAEGNYGLAGLERTLLVTMNLYWNAGGHRHEIYLICDYTGNLKYGGPICVRRLSGFESLQSLDIYLAVNTMRQQEEQHEWSSVSRIAIWTPRSGSQTSKVEIWRVTGFECYFKRNLVAPWASYIDDQHTSAGLWICFRSKSFVDRGDILLKTSNAHYTKFWHLTVRRDKTGVVCAFRTTLPEIWLWGSSYGNSRAFRPFMHSADPNWARLNISDSESLSAVVKPQRVANEAVIQVTVVPSNQGTVTDQINMAVG
ncbi:hypothetical protein F5Y16DRAFT_166066 [Xylariaceae sp. FL0255]|nr:hypothetical protein F5Y16DRAFT_166066 [Xylariaceae sp. FL0255]